MSSSQNLGSLLEHTRTEVNYLVYSASRTRRPFKVWSGAAQIPVGTETTILNEVLQLVGEQTVALEDVASQACYGRGMSPDHVGAVFAKFRAAMLAYIQGLRNDRSYEDALRAAQEAIGGR